MCGFLAYFEKNISPSSIPQYRACSLKLSHRGNGERGELVLGNAALFHERLAFRDLAEGKQPLTDKQNRATIVFNGELYDFQTLRSKLSHKYDFQTRSDTEVILAAYLVLGEDFLSELNGEYAFVIHDHRNNSFVAARDPFGVKPLFFASPQLNNLFTSYQQKYQFSVDNKFCLGSEIKSIPFNLNWNSRGWQRQFVSLYEEMGTAFEGVYQLATGALLKATQTEGSAWNITIERKISKQRQPDKNLDFNQTAKYLKSLVEKAVKDKLDAEVPLGAYLSGGIDSRIAAHEMGKLNTTIETFTVGFEGKDYDETGDVKEFLKKFPNLKGNILRTSNAALEYSYPHAIYASEMVQPYTNGSAKWWLSRFARRKVRGVLTGDGADELFCGYPSYRYMAWWNFYQRNPSQARAMLYANRVVGKSEKFWEKGLSSLPDGSDLNQSNALWGWSHPLFAQVKSLTEQLLGSENLLQQEKSNIASYAALSNPSQLARWQHYFMHTHFPTHVLNWVGDRMEMANTLEGRPVYLTSEILKLYRTLPDHFLVRGMKDKAILRKAYQKELQSFASTPKKQFNAPFLFEGALGKNYLSDSKLKATGLIDPKLVKQAMESRKMASPLEQSFINIFLQNCLVTQMLDEFLVRKMPPTRDIKFEDTFLDKNTETV